MQGLEGKIPESICQLSELEELVLNTNKQPEGEVPKCIGKLTKLKKLFIDYSTGFAGNIKRPNAEFPESIWDLTNLEYVFLRTVSNTGRTIPGDKVAKMTNLKGISIIDCGITGTIPTELFATGELRTLDIYRNAITGSIPTEIGNCAHLSSIKLQQNALTGTIPSEIGNCSKLTLFLLNDNELTGSIPAAETAKINPAPTTETAKPAYQRPTPTTTVETSTIPTRPRREEKVTPVYTRPTPTTTAVKDPAGEATSTKEIRSDGRIDNPRGVKNTTKAVSDTTKQVRSRVRR